MIPTNQGYVPRAGYLGDVLASIDDLKNDKVPKWDMIEMSPLLDSSNMTVHEWNKIAEEIERNYDRYDGFVVLHGTDTMAYTAAALSLCLKICQSPWYLQALRYHFAR